MSQVHLRVSLTIFHGGPQEKMTVDPKEDMIDQLEEVGGGTALWEEAGGGGGKSIHFATSTKSLGRVSSTVKNKRLADWKKVTKIFVSKKPFLFINFPTSTKHHVALWSNAQTRLAHGRTVQHMFAFCVNECSRKLISVSVKGTGVYSLMRTSLSSDWWIGKQYGICVLFGYINEGKNLFPSL